MGPEEKGLDKHKYTCKYTGMNFTIYMPEHLGKRIKKEKLRLSPICQKAVMREFKRGEVAKRLKASGCNPDAQKRLAGSNPALSTKP